MFVSQFHTNVLKMLAVFLNDFQTSIRLDTHYVLLSLHLPKLAVLFSPVAMCQVAVIISNALVMGFSTDFDPESTAWDVTEVDPWTEPIAVKRLHREPNMDHLKRGPFKLHENRI